MRRALFSTCMQHPCEYLRLLHAGPASDSSREHVQYTHTAPHSHMHSRNHCDPEREWMPTHEECSQDQLQSHAVSPGDLMHGENSSVLSASETPNEEWADAEKSSSMVAEESSASLAGVHPRFHPLLLFCASLCMVQFVSPSPMGRCLLYSTSRPVVRAETVLNHPSLSSPSCMREPFTC